MTSMPATVIMAPAQQPQPPKPFTATMLGTECNLSRRALGWVMVSTRSTPRTQSCKNTRATARVTAGGMTTLP